MGLETLLEAAKYLEYRAEVEARGEKGFPDLPSNISTSIEQNGFNKHEAPSNGVNFISHLPFKNQANNNNSSGLLSRVPETLNGFKSDHSYRRINHLSHSPPLDFNNGGSNRVHSSKSSSSSSNSSANLNNNRNSGTREVHNKLEKNRRAHLKECFELLKSQLPTFEDRKISNLAILRSSLRHIQALKRKEKEYDHDMERLAREKIGLQQRLSTLKKDLNLNGKWDHHVEWHALVPEDIDSMNIDTNGHGLGHVAENNQDSFGKNEMRKAETHHKQIKSEENFDRQHKNDDHSTQPLPLTVNNCHIGENITVKKIYGQVNGLNGMSAVGPISLVTAPKINYSPLAAITVEKTANSPIGTNSYLTRYI